MNAGTFVLISHTAVILSCLARPGIAGDARPQGERLPDVICTAEQSGGFHDYPGAGETYEPALFHPQTFTLEENLVFMMNLAAEERNVDLYLTMTHQVAAESNPADVSDSKEIEHRLETTELECRHVRGANESYGFSCVNLPPSEMLLINAQTLRYTRTAVGGWTFAGAAAEHNGDSIFVEYGQCQPGTVSSLDR